MESYTLSSKEYSWNFSILITEKVRVSKYLSYQTNIFWLKPLIRSKLQKYKNISISIKKIFMTWYQLLPYKAMLQF